jgi:DNA-binding MarR family transcriptional regulator
MKAVNPEIRQPTLALVMPILACEFTHARAKPSQSTISGGTQKLTLLAIACFDGQIVRTQDISDVTSYSYTQTHRAIQVLVRAGLVESKPGWRQARRLTINRTALRHRAKGGA